MQTWVSEQSKLLSSQWIIDVIFKLLKYDVRKCLETLSLIDSQELSLDYIDILMTVCISLRAKLITEIITNISKLEETSDECIRVLSTVGRTLSLAHFSLSFPHRQHWKQSHIGSSKSAYVSFVFDHIFLPAIRATNDITIHELLLKLICEAWIDYIYSHQIVFTTAGALTLLGDFGEVKEWLLKQHLMKPNDMKKLVNHEVLRMCKGVGKVLTRKPNDIIPILRLPKNQKSLSEEQETLLPSEMFVSNQRKWLQLKASSRKFSYLVCCPST